MRKIGNGDSLLLKILTALAAFSLFRDGFRRTLLVLAALALTTGCTTTSREMSHIVRERRIHRGELDVSGLPENPPGTIAPGGQGIEEYYLPARAARTASISWLCSITRNNGTG
jgi:hypothetical protein